MTDILHAAMPKEEIDTFLVGLALHIHAALHERDEAASEAMADACGLTDNAANESEQARLFVRWYMQRYVTDRVYVVHYFCPTTSLAAQATVPIYQLIEWMRQNPGCVINRLEAGWLQ